MGDTDPERFVLASVVLTGFSEFELYATGRVSEYHAFLHGVVSREVDAIATELADLPADPADRDRRIRSRVLDDTDLGPVARSLIRLWYLGRWDDPRDPTESRIVSPMAYRAGLAWDAIEAHPPGAEQQGFGSWADRPAGGRR